MTAPQRTSEMDAASTLDGTELVEVVQGGTNKRSTSAAVAGTARAALRPGIFTISTVADDYAPTDGDLYEVWLLQAADNEGSRISGILAPAKIGTRRRLINMAATADDGMIVLLHESTRSDPANRIWCPNGRDFLRSNNAGCDIEYRYAPDGTTPRWFVVSDARALHTETHSLSFFPHLVMPSITGNVDSWEPTAYSAQNDTPYPSGLFAAGVSGLGKDGTCWYLRTDDADGAVLKGLKWYDPNGTAEGHGPLRILMNLGPGAITVKHHGSAVSNDHIHCAGGTDLVVPAVYGSITVIGAQMGGYWVIGKNF